MPPLPYFFSEAWQGGLIIVLGLSGLMFTVITWVSIILYLFGEWVIKGKKGARFEVVGWLASISKDGGWVDIKNDGGSRP